MRRALTLTLCLLAAPPVAASDYTLIPEQFAYCSTCHGVEFQGNRSVDAPRLNGMEDWYLRSQLRAFKQGLRGTHPLDLIGMEMQPQASALSAAAIEQVVELVASSAVRSTTIEHRIRGDSDRGAELYTTCAACHGPKAQGSKVLNAPKLAGQSDWYLVRQLEKYAVGARGYATQDTAGQQMRAAAAVLEDVTDIRDVVAYINMLSGE